MEERQKIDLLVNRYLDSMSEDEAFEIMGVGSFTKAELQEHVRKRTVVGAQIIQMILADANSRRTSASANPN